jgi:peptide deformylase
MIETLHRNNGVGLAAVQVGALKRIVVIDLYEEGLNPFVIINPQIIEAKGIQIVNEGCLSFPNKFAQIERPAEITIEALNEKGEKFKLTGKELLAQAISHEIDHLNGEVFIDKIIPGTLEIITEEKENKKESNKKGI